MPSGGGHTAWAYCHVPNGSTIDATARIEDQIERFAPGFRDCIRARHVLAPRDLERADERGAAIEVRPQRPHQPGQRGAPQLPRLGRERVPERDRPQLPADEAGDLRVRTGIGQRQRDHLGEPLRREQGAHAAGRGAQRRLLAAGDRRIGKRHRNGIVAADARHLLDEVLRMAAAAD